jgi:hypothetical protein
MWLKIKAELVDDGCCMAGVMANNTWFLVTVHRAAVNGGRQSPSTDTCMEGVRLEHPSRRQ